MTTYAERMRSLQQIVNELQRSDDVDVAIELYEKGLEHVKACEERIAAATEKLNLIQNKENT